jgi:MFS family permease
VAHASTRPWGALKRARARPQAAGSARGGESPRSAQLDGGGPMTDDDPHRDLSPRSDLDCRLPVPAHRSGVVLAAISIPVAILGIGLIAILVSVLRPWVKARGWRDTPVELVAFVGFSALVVVLDAVVQAIAPEFAEESIQYTGWAASMPYLFGVIMGTFLCVHRTTRGRIWLLVYLAFSAVWGGLEFWSDFGERDFENPYLRLSPYRPIWTVAIPLVWLVVLLSPRVKRYCSVKKREFPARTFTRPPSQASG